VMSGGNKKGPKRSSEKKKTKRMIKTVRAYTHKKSLLLNATGGRKDQGKSVRGVGERCWVLTRQENPG